MLIQNKNISWHILSRRETPYDIRIFDRMRRFFCLLCHDFNEMYPNQMSAIKFLSIFIACCILCCIIYVIGLTAKFSTEHWDQHSNERRESKSSMKPPFPETHRHLPPASDHAQDICRRLR